MTFTGLNKLFPLAVLLLLASILVSPFSGKSALGVSPSEFDISLAKTSSKQLNVLENFLPLERAVLGCCVGAEGPPNAEVIDGKTCVYNCVVDGTTRYVGITDDVARRGAEHLRTRNIRIEKIDGLDGLSRADARAVEQTLINYHGLGKDGGTLLNKINSISPTRNPTAYEKSLIRGKELLDSVDYQWTN